MMLALVGFAFLVKPMTVNAIPISTGGIPFDDHSGMELHISGEDGFCIQRGYPFRSTVSDIQMTRTVRITLRWQSG